MAADVTLPPGFVLDQPPPIPKTPASGLPPGFVLDAPTSPQAPPPPPPGSVQFPYTPSGEQQPPFLQSMFQAATSPQTAGGPTAMAGREGMSQVNQAIEKGAYEGGGAVTDIASRAGLPPEAAAGAGMGTNMAIQGIPSMLGAMAGKAIEPTTKPIGRALMQSALKPGSVARASGDSAKAVETMLKGGFSATQGGVAKMRVIVKALSKDVDDMVAASKGTVDKNMMRQELLGQLKNFRTQVNPRSDVKAILKSWDEFKHTVPSQIPVQQAHDIKRGTYKILADKYARMGQVTDEAGTQAQMALARGLRKGVEKQVPGVVAPNKEMEGLINAIELAEQRASVAGNRDLAGIAWLASHPVAGGGMLADRSQLIKSLLARGLYSGMPGAGALSGAAYTGEEELAKRR